MRRLPTTLMVLLTVLPLVTAQEAAAAGRQRIRALNVGLQPLFTLASAALQGKLHGRADVIRCLRVGAAAGYGFYESKRMAGNGHTLQALAIANVGSSMTRNAAAGRHAFARVGVTVGPTRTEVSTPFESAPDARFHVEASFSDAVAMAWMWQKSGERPTWRDGLIAFRKRGTYDADDRHFTGYTIGVFPGTSYGAAEVTWHHETVHAIQALQGNAIEPPACVWRRRCRDEKPRDFRLIRFDGVRLGVIPAGGGWLMSRQDYTKRWTEIEATRLAENQEPR